MNLVEEHLGFRGIGLRHNQKLFVNLKPSVTASAFITSGENPPLISLERATTTDPVWSLL